MSGLCHGPGTVQVLSLEQWQHTEGSFPGVTAECAVSLQERTVGGENLGVAVGAAVMQPATRTGAAQ